MYAVRDVALGEGGVILESYGGQHCMTSFAGGGGGGCTVTPRELRQPYRVLYDQLCCAPDVASVHCNLQRAV